MDYSVTERQEMLRRVARDFFTKELPKSLVEELVDDPQGYKPDLWKKMADLGWMGLIVPEDYCGFGGNYLDLVILLEEAGRACLPGPFFSTAVTGALTIIEAGSEHQKQELLPRIASGDAIVTVALSEPDSVYTTDHYKVEARPDNKGYIISGTKLFVPDAHIADHIICVARTGKDITLFLLATQKLEIESLLLSKRDLELH